MVPSKQINTFDETRRQHSLESAEDYTELIADLIESEGEARVGVIAEHLGISHVTALRTISRLQQLGYVETQPRKPVTLTRKGQNLAKFCKHRHSLLLDFFIEIGVEKKQAELDVEGAEHHISKQTLKKIEELLERLRKES